jgi:hypothetical protein
LFQSKLAKVAEAIIGRLTITMCEIATENRIMLHPQAPKDQPWFWTIIA